uniref:EGF-like domain-containing protein n=1 Tax=Panagrolaimus sp. JU765 TaxID=591449 RepID=A0AC34QHB9_9BILA
MVYTNFIAQHDGPVQFNISVGARARIAIYARMTLEPSLTAYNYVQTIRGDHLHVAGISRRQKRENHDVENAFKSTIIQFHLLPGKWYLGFFNDGFYPEPITFIANIVSKEANSSSLTCKYNCFSKGTCRNGKCLCNSGFSGEFCEETACPVLCNGNGIFANGKCSCHEGFKGAECDLDASWCQVPDCNKNGECGSDGKCHCNHGWKGEFCDERTCEDPNCSNNGICENGTCFCAAGWYGSLCEQRISSACSPLEAHKLGQKSYQPSSVPRDFSTVNTDKQKLVNQHPVILEKSVKLDDTCSSCVHGVCKDGQCICEMLYSGDDCSIKQCLPGCEEHGICNDGVCECNQGWNGDNCFIEGCYGNCSDGGSCQLVKGTWQCACDSGHYGRHCELKSESNCDDGIDNDDDGLVDCEDSECCSSKFCATNPICTNGVLPRDVLLRSQLPSDSNFFQMNKFLIEADSVQRYADIKLFNESQASVIRGKVISSKGGPLTGVRISNTLSPRFGFSLSRSDDNGGTFDIMVNGGGFVNLQFLRQPFGKVERSFFVPVNSIINVGEIVMNDFTPSILQREISNSCQIHHFKHSIIPQFVASWMVNQYAGNVKSDNDLAVDMVKIIADARIVHQSIPIEDTTDLELVYNSGRADGFLSAIHMGLLPSMIPESLRLIHLRIQVAGRIFEEVLAAKPNLTFTFNWNHLNVYDQPIYGLTKASISVGYEYDKCSKKNEIVWHFEQVEIEGRKAHKSAFGLWSFNFQHYYDHVNNILERGDGITNYLSKSSFVMKTLVGTQKQREAHCDKDCMSQPLSDARLFQPNAIAVASDGTMFIGDYNTIRMVNAKKTTITVVLELVETDIVHSYYLAVDPFTAELYISIPLKRQIWKLKSTKKINDPTKNYKVVVGDGSTCTDDSSICGDRGLAKNSQLNFPKDITFDMHGNLYVLDGRRIRYISKDEQIYTLHSSPEWKPAENCSPSFPIEELNFEWPISIVFEPISSTLIVLDTDIVYKIHVQSGVVNVLAGIKKGCSPSSHGTPAIQNAQAIALSAETGQLFIAESDSKRTNLIRSMSVNGGHLRIIAGRTSKCDCDRVNCPCDETSSKESTLATKSFLHKPVALATDSGSRIYVADQANFKIKIIEPSHAVFDHSSRLFKVISPDMNEIYYFNKHGMHQKTVDLLSGQDMLIFKYSVDTSFGEISEVIAHDGLSLKITRVNETEVILESFRGKKSVVKQSIFDKQLIDTIATMETNSKKCKFEYTPGQLIKSTETKDQTYFFDYDKNGRLTVFSKLTGEVYSFSPDYHQGNEFAVDVALNGFRIKRFAIMDEGNLITEDGNVTFISKDDSVIYNSNKIQNQFDASSHPLLKPEENVVLKRKITVAGTENNPELNSRFEWRSYVRAGANKQISHVGRRPRINGRNMFTIEFDRRNLTDTFHDAFDNSLMQITYNTAGQVTRMEFLNNATIAPLNVTYNHHGMMTTVVWDNHRQDFAYDFLQRLILETFSKTGDLLVRKYSYGHDQTYEPSMVRIPSGGRYKWKYDKHGKVSSLKAPDDEISEFWAVNGFRPGAAKILFRKLLSGNVSKLAVAVYDSRMRLMGHFLPGHQQFQIKRNDFGEIMALLNGNSTTKFHKEDNKITVTKTGLMIQYFYRGFLISDIHKSVDGVETSRINYDYDDLFRIKSIKMNVLNVFLKTHNFVYDELSGKLKTVGDCLFDHFPKKTVITSKSFSIETSKSSTNQIKHVQILISDTTLMESKFFYDGIGRLAKQTFKFNEMETMETFDYNMDGLLSEYSSESKENNRWTIVYSESGRVQKIMKDSTIEYSHPGNDGFDENGWVIQQRDRKFSYDSLGQLVKISSKRGEAVFSYDEKHRVIFRNCTVTKKAYNFYYAELGNEKLITHFHDILAKKLWTIYYDPETRPFLMKSSENEEFILVVDAAASLKFVFSTNKMLMKQIDYSPFGEIIYDSNEDLFVPIGFHGHFHDYSANVAFVCQKLQNVPVTRPLNLKTGRFLTTSLNLITPLIDTYDPENVADPCRYTLPPQTFVLDPLMWMSMAGVEMKHVLPLINTNFAMVPPEFLSKPGSFMQLKTGLMSQILTMRPSKFTPPLTKKMEHQVFLANHQNFTNSCKFVVFSNKNQITAKFMNNEPETKVLASFLQNSTLIVEFYNWHNTSLDVLGYYEIHLLKSEYSPLPKQPAFSCFKINTEKDQKLEIFISSFKIIIHVGNNLNEIQENIKAHSILEMTSNFWLKEENLVKKIPGNES